jgi:hypothetical protein
MSKKDAAALRIKVGMTIFPGLHRRPLDVLAAF